MTANKKYDGERRKVEKNQCKTDDRELLIKNMMENEER